MAKTFPGKAKCRPAQDTMLLPFQTRWVDDKSRLKIAEKSRQIGWTWSTAFSLVARKALTTARQDAWVSSRDEMQAREFLLDCKGHAQLLQPAAKDLGQRVVDEDGHTAHVLSMSNGLRIHSMSSNPDAQAGKRGDRVLDEFALHPDPRKLYAIAYPGITWGGQLEIFSTHRGSGNFFNKLIEECRHKGNPKGFSVHRVTLEDALNEGLLYKLQCRLPEDDERQGMDETDYFNFIKAGCADEETFAQEYMCVPADDASAFLPFDLIDTCLLRGNEDLEVAKEETRDFSGRKGWIRKLAATDFDPRKALGELYLGVDIGRDRDLTVLWLLERYAGILLPRLVVEMGTVEFDRQESELYPLLKLPKLRRCCIDNTGLGKQFAERAQKRFGQYKVEAVTFSAPVKETLAYPLRSVFEDRSIRIPDDREVIADLRAIRKETTQAGNIRFAADSGPGGHADRFWAVALAVHAAGSGVGTISRGETVPRQERYDRPNVERMRGVLC